jgi:hypothetical protein
MQAPNTFLGLRSIRILCFRSTLNWNRRGAEKLIEPKVLDQHIRVQMDGRLWDLLQGGNSATELSEKNETHPRRPCFAFSL